MAQSAPATESKGPINMGTDSSTCSGVLTSTPYPSSLAERTLRREIPKVGARCVNHARRDLCGGHLVMGVPTAIAAASGVNRSVTTALADELSPVCPLPYSARISLFPSGPDRLDRAYEQAVDLTVVGSLVEL